MADQIDEIAAELYAVDPARFVAARAEAVHRAQATGDRRLATVLGRLRRPTVSAWAVNLLARSARAELAELAELGEELRAAQRQLQGARLRQLNQRRRELIGTLSRRARQLAADDGHPLSSAMVAEVEQTLAAALADPDSAQTVCSGRLTRPLQHVGLGAEPVLPPSPPSPVDAESARSAAPAPSPPDDELARQRRRREERLARDLARADQQLEDAQARAARAEQEVRQAAERCADLDRRLAQLQQECDEAAREHAEVQRRAQSAARVRDEAQRQVLRLTEECKAVR
jgi:septal ring factor EnvC (AmiA/AmiB activator)